MNGRIKVFVALSMVAAFVAVGAANSTAGAQTDKGMCAGLPVTVDIGAGDVPTEGDDVIRGTNGADSITALGGNDTICALAGDDLINAGDGFDDVFAGAGEDSIVGGAGNDLLVGGPGADIIFGDTGNDRVQGGDGDDALQGGGGLDRVAGGNGNDAISGGTHADELLGNLGRDELRGDGGDDILRGGAWLDRMDGGTGTDRCTLTDPAGLVEVRDNCELGLQGNAAPPAPAPAQTTALSRVFCQTTQLDGGLDLAFDGDSAAQIWAQIWQYGVPRGGWISIDGVDVGQNAIDFTYIDDVNDEAAFDFGLFDESELAIFDAEGVHSLILDVSVRNGQVTQFSLTTVELPNFPDFTGEVVFETRTSPGGFDAVQYPDSYNTGTGGQLERVGTSLRVIDNRCNNPEELGGA